jgi:lipoprotein NlpI
LPKGWTEEVSRFLSDGRNDDAVQLLNRAVAASPDQPSVYMIRGQVLFRLGKIEDSLRDFDKSIELNPESAPENWQRGISLYYLQKFEAGRKQFEIHQTVNPNDVENAFWHFLCVVKLDGIDAARKALLPCGHDSRAPLIEVLGLLQGKLAAEDVEKAIENAHGGPTGRSIARFYGHLYLGLYYDALGESERAKKHLEKAVAEKIGGYMRDVAFIHLKQMNTSWDAR